MKLAARLALLSFLPLVARGASLPPYAGEGLWRAVEDPAAFQTLAAGRSREALPRTYRLVELDRARLAERLAEAPLERTDLVARRPLVVELPLADGSLQRFSVVESPLLSRELAARNPGLRSFAAQGIDDPTATARLDLTPDGFHAMILGTGSRTFIDPVTDTSSRYLVADGRQDGRERATPFTCSVPESPVRSTPRAASLQTLASPTVFSTGPTLRSYRLALSATGEYAAAVCAPKPVATGCATVAMAVTVSRVSGILEKELAIRLNVVSLNAFLDPATDPYSNGNADLMAEEHQVFTDFVLGTSSYDIGHVFGTGNAGAAAVGSVCDLSRKAKGATCRSVPFGDYFDVDRVAHQVGHQFGASHTFNADGEGTVFCSGNRVASAAYEPGSGSTIMGYAGLCGAGNNVQTHSDAYFHRKSFDEIMSFLASGGGACYESTGTGNDAPTVIAPAGYVIPSRTPFSLSAAASDPDDDELTYCWEEYDLGTASPPESDDGYRPLFRSYPPSTSPTRTFPSLSRILAGRTGFPETLPSTDRTMRFSVTVRDNRFNGGGVAYPALPTLVRVVAGAGPFAITQPNTTTTWTPGSTQTVAWNVAGTYGSPVSCTDVAIALSTDGGLTFGHTLASSAPNTGSAAVKVPAIATKQGRVKVSCVGNVFFDISDVDFTIADGSAGGCVATSTTLCIDGSVPGDGRFKVELDWYSSQAGGKGGRATAVPTAPIGFTQGGVFWIFAPNNPEVLVKVLDGCAVNSRFWVFTSALTNVGLTTTVTDTSNGTFRIYVNPDLNPAQPVQDVDAFPCD